MFKGAYRKFNNALILTAGILATGFSAFQVSAQDAPCTQADFVNGICLPAKPTASPSFDSLGALMGFIINIALLAVGMIAVLFVVIGGYKYLTASGNEEQLESGKKTIINALMGLVLVLLAYALVRITVNILT